MGQWNEFVANQLPRALASFRAPAATGDGRGVQLPELRNVLDGWLAQQVGEAVGRAEERTDVAAAAAQRESGLQSVAAAPDDIARRYQSVWEKRANTVFLQQLQTDALRQDLQFRQKHRNDPEGFMRAWQNYSTARLDAVRKDAPVLGLAAEQVLEERGVSSWATISEQAFRHEQALSEVKFVQGIDETMAQYRDAMLAPGAERDLERQAAFATVMQELDAGLETGLLSPAKFSAYASRVQDDITGDWARGHVYDMLAQGDFAGAMGLVEGLLRGDHFVDNDRGRQVANELASRIRQSMEAPGRDDTKWLILQNLQDTVAKARAGLEVGDPERDSFEDGLQFLINEGDVRSLREANVRQSQLAAADLLKQYERFGPSSLEAVLKTLEGSQQPRESLEMLAGPIQDRVRTIRDTLQSGTMAEIRDLYPDAPFRDVVVALRGEVPLDAVPTFSTRHVERAFRRSFQEGNTAEVFQKFAAELAQRDSGLSDLFYSMRESDLDPAMRESVVLGALAWEAGLSEFAGMAFNLGGLENVPPEVADVRYQDLGLRSQHVRMLDSLVGHDPNLRGDVQQAILGLTQAMVAARPDDFSGRDSKAKAARAAKEILRTLEQIPTVEVGGLMYPESLFGGGPEQQRVRAREIDRQLRQMRSSGQGVRELSLHADGTGGFAVRGVAGNIIELPKPERVTEAEDNAALAAAISKDEWEAYKNDPGWLRAFEDSLPYFRNQASREAWGAKIRTSAARAGVPEEEIRRLAIAVLRTPSEQKGGRVGDFAALPSIMEQMHEAPNMQAMVPSNPASAARVFGKLRDRYKGETAAALAAYWAGPVAVDRFMDQFGERWLDSMPVEVQAFVSRGMLLTPEQVQSIYDVREAPRRRPELPESGHSIPPSEFPISP